MILDGGGGSVQKKTRQHHVTQAQTSFLRNRNPARARKEREHQGGDILNYIDGSQWGVFPAVRAIFRAMFLACVDPYE